MEEQSLLTEGVVENAAGVMESVTDEVAKVTPKKIPGVVLVGGGFLLGIAGKWAYKKVKKKLTELRTKQKSEPNVTVEFVNSDDMADEEIVDIPSDVHSEN